MSNMRNRLTRSGTGIALTAVALLAFGFGSSARASKLVTQTAFPGANFTKFIDPMPEFGSSVHPRLDGTKPLTVRYKETGLHKPLPNNFTYTGGFTGTYIWGYELEGTRIDTQVPFTSPIHWPGFTIEVQKGTPATVTYENDLGTVTNGTYTRAFLQSYLTVDQSIHWANPLVNPMMVTNPNPPPAMIGNPDVYLGPLPVVAHLHGGEVPSEFDGGPEAWFTQNGIRGNAYRTAKNLPLGVNPPLVNQDNYTYPNEQEATTLWYHDHALGITRLNVYGGLAAFYLIRDSFDTGTASNAWNLPAGNYEREIVIQDRQFDTQGQLLFPDGYPAGLNGPPTNPLIHPYWNPEFFGDTIAVNGELWPFFQVEPRRYRLRLLNGSNARFYTLNLGTVTPIGQARGNKGKKTLGGPTAPQFYVIGTDGGLLDSPVAVTNLTIAPGERYDVIVDFTGFDGKAITMTNSARAPFPAGATPDNATTAQIMQFQVTSLLGTPDNSFNPAAAGATLRGGAGQPPVINRLVDPVGGTAIATPAKTRQLVLREIVGPGGPIEVLLNNTKWNGLQEGTTTPVSGSSLLGPNWATELPQVGSTEMWEIINLTGDAHPIHVHLVQFQLMNRQPFQLTKYTANYQAAFPAGVAIDGYGPPADYITGLDANGLQITPFLGGNPDVTPYLQNGVTPPHPWEAGWKDTVIMMPGEVTRIMVRWTPQSIAVGSETPGSSQYPGFNPTGLTPISYGPDQVSDAVGPGYVWHCHILDHEDNEMMRPYIPVDNANNVYSAP